MVKPLYRQTLICGCCCRYFKNDELRDFSDRDKGYGFCQECYVDDLEDQRKEIQKGIKFLRNSLSENKRMVFDGFDKEMQEVLFYEALEDGVISYKIG